MNELSALELGLQDPVLPGVTCLISEQKEAFLKALKQFPEGTYVSEWKYESGHAHYKYRIHEETTGKELKKSYSEENTSKHPRLTGIYTISELESKLGQ